LAITAARFALDGVREQRRAAGLQVVVYISE